MKKIAVPDKFQVSDIMITPQCETCVNRIDGLHCKAFPNGIPLGILTNAIDHKKAIDGDNGITYKAKK